MSASEDPGQELRAALGARQELGPDYEPEIIESFLERLDRTIEARVDERIDARLANAPAAEKKGTSAELVFASMLGGVLGTGAVGGTMQADGVPVVIIIWLVIAVINVAHALAGRPRPSR